MVLPGGKRQSRGVDLTFCVEAIPTHQLAETGCEHLALTYRVFFREPTGHGCGPALILLAVARSVQFAGVPLVVKCLKTRRVDLLLAERPVALQLFVFLQ